MADENSNASSPEGGEPQQDNVFQKFIKTVTFNNGYKNDGKDPGFKMLDSAAVNSAQAMKGIKPGTKQTRIKGNSAFHYMGDHYVIIDGNDILFVQGTQRHTIKGKTELLCLADYLRAVKGNEAIRVNQTHSTIILGASEENYLGKHEVTAPEEFEWKSFERGFSFTKLDLMALGWDLHGAEITTKGADVDVGVENAEGSVFHQELKANHDKGEAIYSKVGAEADALLRVDILLDVGLGTPFR